MQALFARVSLIMHVIAPFLVHRCDMQGLDDKELSAYIKSAREPQEVIEAINKLRGMWKINCENMQKGKRQQWKYCVKRPKRIRFKPGELLYWK
jgi:hypothetical protein